MKKIALIVAGGSGTRMGADVPKQFLLIGNKPVLMHTMEAFHTAKVDEILIVLPSSEFDSWQNLCKQYNFKIPHQVIAGGDARFYSVRNGLDQIDNNSLVAIHDGVRPFITTAIIENSFSTAQAKGNAVVSVPLKDSIRRVDLLSNRSANRNNYYLIQTPQTFQSKLIKEAYAKAEHINFTDDAGVLEENGHAIHLIHGDYKNIKITTPEDLIIAEAFLKQTSTPPDTTSIH
ncbi:MAG: 2-C-methyl-D-erythritol 4-phosphate cytidylyltransferase [Bacteroidota bacterium]